MKKYSLLYLSLLLCVLLYVCTTQHPFPSPQLINNSHSVTETPVSVHIANPSTAIPEIIGSTLTPGNESPTIQQREKMAQQMGDLGFSVLRYDENMLNYEAVAEFLQNAVTGKDGEITVYTYPWTYVVSQTFSFENGKMTCTFNNYTAEGAQPEESQNVNEFTYTEKGNYIYQLEGSSEKSGFRVLPLSKESREYFRKYVVPGNIFTKGPLDVTWNSEDFSGLNWEWIFEGLWENENGKDLLDSEYYRKASGNTHFDYALIPSAVVEGLLQKYFNVPTQTLRTIDKYDKKSDTYTFQGFNGGGYSPTLEVSKWQNNADGTLTLWINFVALEFGKELSAQSVLTIKPEKDGSFKYFSNDYSAY